MRRQGCPAVVVRSGRVSAYASVRFPARSTPHICSRLLDLAPLPHLHLPARSSLRKTERRSCCIAFLSVFHGPETLPATIKEQPEKRSENRAGFCTLHKKFAVSRGCDM